MSMKRPFGKVRKIERKQETEQKNQQVEQKPFIQQEIQKEGISKTPVFNLGPKKAKFLIPKEKNVYDVLKKNQNGQVNKQEEQKLAVSTKPDLLKKRPKMVVGEKNPIINNQEQSFSNSDAPKPTPLFRGKKTHIQLKNRSREKVIIEETLENQQQNNHQISTSFRPDLKIKNKIQKTGRSRKQNENENQIEDSRENLQQKSRQVDKPSYNEESNRNKGNVNHNYIQPTQINLQKVPQSVNHEKRQAQAKRSGELKSLLNIQMDLFQDLLSISSISEYQVYISKIKNGALKNSMDQAFDEKTHQSTQTQLFELVSIQLQFPQNHTAKNDESQALDTFLLKVAPVIEQLIRPSNQVIMPPIFLLAFKPTFLKIVKCPYPVFLYHTAKLGIAVISQKLFISQGHIISILSIGPYMIGGLSNGKIAIWTGINDKSNRLYSQIYQTIQSTNFQLPSYINYDLEKSSLYQCFGAIVGLIALNQSEFYSLQQYGKLIKWKIQQNIYKNIVAKGLQSINLADSVQQQSLICFSFKYRNQNLFISSSQGILVCHKNQIIQKLLIRNLQIIDFQLPKRSNLVYVICQNDKFQIFDQNYSSELFSLTINTQSALKNIIIPQIEHDSRQIPLLDQFYIANEGGDIFYFNLNKNSNENVELIETEKDRGVLHRSVHSYKDRLEVITLMNDLRCTKLSHRMNINLEKSIPNLKKIVENNRKIHSLFEFQHKMI